MPFLLHIWSYKNWSSTYPVSDELAQEYFELVKQSEAVKIEKDEVSQTEKIKEMYDEFVRKKSDLRR